jgi:hypothetical protein
MTTPALVVAVNGAVPESWPVAILKFAQEGLFWILNESASPLASAAVGLKLYAAEAGTDVAGLPEMVGAALVTPLVTRIENGGRDDDSLPSLAVTTIFGNVAFMPAGAVPVNTPVYRLKLPHEGLPDMLNRIRSPFASVAFASNV